MSDAGKLGGKVVIVTGGASAIGRAIAIRSATAGAKAVIVADLRPDPREGGEPTHEVIRAAGSSAEFVPTDVTDTAALARMVEAAESFGGVDVLINNAGLLRGGKLVDATEADFDAMIAVNVKGVFFACQAAARSWIASGRGGVIVNLSSIGGLAGLPGISAYSSTKGAVRLLTYALAKELGHDGIRVCALHPGVIDTSMNRDDVPVLGENTGKVARGIALGRVGEADDIARAAVFLASDEASFITGTSLTVDGGQLCIG